MRAYTALDNPIRLKAYLLIRASGDIPFHALAKRLGVESGLLAYHLGVLKVADLVEMRYERAGREISRYRLSERGKELYPTLFPPRKETSRKSAKASVRVAAR